MCCRYKVTATLQGGHLVVGRLSNFTDLNDEEIELIQGALPDAKLDHCIVYYRVLVNGVIYTSSCYQRHTTTNDYVLCVGNKDELSFGYARKYLSTCKTTCTSCCSPCNNIVIVDMFQVVPCDFVTDTSSGATARHIHSVASSGYVDHFYIHFYKYIYTLLIYV